MIRRVLVTGSVTLAVMLTSGSGLALAAAQDDTAAAPTLSATSVSPGTSFTVTPPQPCPSASGAQDVFVTYTDSEDTTYQLDLLTTDDSGAWDATTVRLPVTGPDENGAWNSAGVAAGPGTVDVLCLDSAYMMAAGDASSFSSAAPGRIGQRMIDPDDPDDPGDDPDDPGDDEDGVTLTYAPAALTVSGNPARVNLTPSLVVPGGTVAVSPVDVCAAAATTARIEVSPAALSDDGGDDSGDGSGDGSDDDVAGLGAEADPNAIVTTEVDITGNTWAATQLPIPDDAPLGDYGVTVDCLDAAQEISSRYESAPLALGTVTAGPPVCSAKGATVRLTGTYPDTLMTGDDELDLPATLRLSGAGPWPVSLTSALTDGVVLKQKFSCPAPDYEMTVPKTSVSSAGAVRARVCNTGDAAARAVLQVATRGRAFATVERQVLEKGECAWLDGGSVKRGDSARGRVLLDPPGHGATDQEVAHSFTVRRKG
ncbi:hypothetical protein [Kineosporia sp. NBRC 101731]|uniref:hypothetical protein n=1 Tax=Kineosporia sp. NBRC 101731 TaxID=3032199 RepID=UPI0024A54F4A|nr:hypothetical protein [Kineosporia sp. NBRC 101731]GLY33632.1 hypothetical protein Kisp02_69970 [Kineosporia sp. NBRC 101731]